MKLRNQRKSANEELLQTLQVLVKEYGGDLRFGQILSSFGFVSRVDVTEEGFYWMDEYYLEPSHLLTRVKEETTKVFNAMAKGDEGES